MFNTQPRWPQEWQVRPLERIADHITSGGTPTSGSPRYYSTNGGLPFAKTEDLTRSQSKFIDNCELNITEPALNESAAKRYPAGTILVSMYGTIGLTRITAREMAANQALCALVPPFICDRDYLYHHLEFIRPEWIKFSGQTTQANINGSIVRGRGIPLPPSSEQQKIAKVLDTLDTTIRQSEAIIEKLKQVKQGLLHDLLTRGIDASGELRLPHSEAPHLYQESVLGWIPSGWEARRLESCTQWSSGGTPSKAVASNWLGEVPLLTPKDMKSFELADTTEHISEGAAATGTRLMPVETVFIVVRGMILAHSFPVVLSLRPMAFNQDIKAISARPGILPRFLAHWFTANKELFLRKVTESTHGTKKLDTDQLLPVNIGLPSETEQQAIVERYSALDARLSTEHEYIVQLRELKSGLMDDLLTGRVRVTPLLQEGNATR